MQLGSLTGPGPSSRTCTIGILSDIHYASAVERARGDNYEIAGIPNPLFAADNCLLLFEDGKKAVVDVVAALKEAA